MNYLAHGRMFLDRPYFLAGTAIPDWLNVVNRRIRVRKKKAEPLLESTEPTYREIAAGVVQHHQDDDWFHRTRAFAELSLAFAVILRDGLPADDGLRPSFLGHILVEILLDSHLADEDPSLLDQYYAGLEAIDPRVISGFVREATDQDASNLAILIPKFLEARFLGDYADDEKLLYRLNQVMKRVGLQLIPGDMISLLPEFRSSVRRRAPDLLTPSKMER